MFVRAKNLGDKKLVASKEVSIAHVNHDEVPSCQKIGRFELETNVRVYQQNFAKSDKTSTIEAEFTA